MINLMVNTSTLEHKTSDIDAECGMPRVNNQTANWSITGREREREKGNLTRVCGIPSYWSFNIKILKHVSLNLVRLYKQGKKVTRQEREVKREKGQTRV